MDGSASSQASPWANLVHKLSSTSCWQRLQATLRITLIMKHDEGLSRYSDKLKFALQLNLDRAISFMSASETHASDSVETVLV